MTTAAMPIDDICRLWGESLSAKNAALLLGVTPSTVWRWTQDGILRQNRFGKYNTRELAEILYTPVKPRPGRPRNGVSR